MMNEIVNNGFMVPRLCIFVEALLIIKFHFISLPALALYCVLIRPRAKFALHQIAVSLDTLSRYHDETASKPTNQPR